MQFIEAIQKKLTSIHTHAVDLAATAKAVDFAEVARDVDAFCATHVNNAVDFLDEHPGISMALSPSTVLRRCAQKHAERQIARA